MQGKNRREFFVVTIIAFVVGFLENSFFRINFLGVENLINSTKFSRRLRVGLLSISVIMIPTETFLEGRDRVNPNRSSFVVVVYVWSFR